MTAQNFLDDATEQDLPTAWYRLGELSGTTTADSSRFGNAAGTIAGGITKGVTPATNGGWNGAMQSDGASGSNITIPSSTYINYNRGHDFSVEFWFRYTGSGDFSVMEKWSGASKYPFAFRTGGSNTDLRFGRYDGTNNPTVSASGVTLNDGNWHHVVGVVSGTIMLLYIDGMLNGQVTDTTTTETGSSDPLTLLNRGGGGHGLPGALDEVAIYPYALSATRVRAHYMAGITVNTGSVYRVVIGDPITGRDVSQYFEWEWTVDATYGQRGATATFRLSEDLQFKATPALIVKPLTRITVYDMGLGATIFGGVILNPKLYKYGPMLNTWTLTCRDYAEYSDNVIVNGDYSNKTLDFIIKDLNTQANCGITTANVQPGPLIARVVINYLTLTDAWVRACQYASQGAVWGWFVDDTLDLHTFDALKTTAKTSPSFVDTPSTVDNVITFPYVQDNFCYEWAGDSVRNRIKVRGGNYTGPATDNFVGNGQQSVWGLAYPIDSSNPAATVTVNGVPVTTNIDTGSSTTTPAAGTAVLTQTPSGVWIIRFGTVPPNAQNIVVKYNLLMPVLTRVDDISSQQQYGGPNRGIYEMYLSDATITSLLTAKARGQREISEYGVAEERVMLITFPSNAYHVHIGDVLPIASSQVPDFAAPGYPFGISKNFVISQLHIEGQKGALRAYSFTGVRVS